MLSDNMKLFAMLDWHQSGPIKWVLLVITGSLVGNAVFSEMALRIFLNFSMKGTIKVEK